MAHIVLIGTNHRVAPVEWRERIALAPDEIAVLLEQRHLVADSHHCPHGRPLWRLIPYGDIHQSFRRPK